MPQERVVRIIGEDGFVYDVPLDITTIQIPLDVQVGGGLLGMSKDQRLSDYEELIGFGQNPVYGPYIRPDAVLADYFRERGKRNVQRYIRTEDEVLARQLMGMAPGGLGSGVGGGSSEEGGGMPMQEGSAGGGMDQGAEPPQA